MPFKGAGDCWGEQSKVIAIVQGKPVSTARAAHSSEGEYVTRKAICCIIAPGKDYGKVIEITAGRMVCPRCGGEIRLFKGVAACGCAGPEPKDKKEPFRDFPKHFLKRCRA